MQRQEYKVYKTNEMGIFNPEIRRGLEKLNALAEKEGCLSAERLPQYIISSMFGNWVLVIVVSKGVDDVFTTTVVEKMAN